MLSLRLFGSITLSDPERPIPARARQRRQLALIAILSAPAARPVSRDRLSVLLWPDAGPDHARHLLSDTIYVLRSALGDDFILTEGETVAVNLERVSIDVVEFTHAIEKRDYRKAVEIRSSGGPFLDGAHLIDSPEFERWMDGMRVELGIAYHDALRQIATAAGNAGDPRDAVGWWRRLASEDPLSAPAALELMRALDAAGDRAAALAHARVYGNLVRSELDADPDPTITAFAEKLRNGVGSKRSGSAPPVTPPTAVPALTDSKLPMEGATPEIFSASDHAVEMPRRRRGWRVLRYASALLLVIAIGALGLWRTGALPGSAKASAQPVDYRLRYRTKNPTAYALYLRGRQHRELRNPAGFHAAIVDYSAAIDLDSTYAEAYAGLAEAYTLLRVAAAFDTDPPRETALKAEAAALKATRLADSLGEAHMVLGLVRLSGPVNFVQAEREMRLAHALDPADPRTSEYLIAVECWTGRPEQALRDARALVAADQMSMGALRELGRALVCAHRYDEALAEFDQMRTVGVNPVKMAPVMAAETYDVLGLYPNALHELAGRPGNYVRALTAYTFGRMGNRRAADSVLTELIDRWRNQRGGAYEVAVAYTGMRNFDQAFAWLDKSFDDLSLRGEIMQPMFEDVRADPRFATIRKRINLPEHSSRGNDREYDRRAEPTITVDGRSIT